VEANGGLASAGRPCTGERQSGLGDQIELEGVDEAEISQGGGGW